MLTSIKVALLAGALIAQAVGPTSAQEVTSGSPLEDAAVSTESAQRTGPLQFDLTVELNGSHPNGLGSWDGRRFFGAPIEASNQSPADLEIALIQNRVVWGANGGGSICPDRNACTFRNLPVDPELPFGIVVLDHDGFAPGIVERHGTAVAELIERHASTLSGDGTAGLLAQTGHALGVGIREQLGRAEAGNAKFYQVIDAVVMRPVSADGTPYPVRSPAVQVIEDEIRRLAKQVSPPSILWNQLSRFEGELTGFEVWDCVWPAPSCALSYANIQLKELDR